MTTPVSSIRNLGPVFESSCTAAGIHSAEDVRALGADAVYAKLIISGMRPHFIGYYVLVMGLQGRPWNDCKGAEKTALRVKFDTIKSQNSVSEQSEFERMMNVIGVRDR